MHWYVNYPESETFLTPMHNFDFSYPAHLHGCLEISFCVFGEVRVFLEDKEHILKENQGILIPYNRVHSYHTPESSEFYTILFSRNLLPDLSTLFINKDPHSPVFILYPSLKQHLLDFYNSQQTTFGGKSLLYRAAEAFMKDNSFDQRSHTDNDLMLRIISYIQANLTGELTLEDLAKHLGYSYHYISKQVHQYFRIPFTELLAQYRVDYAKQLLDSRSCTISQAAIASGFGSIRSFNRIFCRLTGLTPSQYLSRNTQSQILRP